MLSPGDVGCLLALSASPNLILELSQQELEISCLHRAVSGITWRPARLSQPLWAHQVCSPLKRRADAATQLLRSP